MTKLLNIVLKIIVIVLLLTISCASAYLLNTMELSEQSKIVAAVGFIFGKIGAYGLLESM